MAKKRKPAAAIIGDIRMEMKSVDGDNIIMIADRIPDKPAALIGHFLIGWGQFQHDLVGFTRNLLKYNGNEDIPRVLELRRLLETFEIEYKLAFGPYPGATAMFQSVLDVAKQQLLGRREGSYFGPQPNNVPWLYGKATAFPKRPS